MTLPVWWKSPASLASEPTPIRADAQTITAYGRTLGLRSWQLVTGITHANLRHRVAMGMSHEDAVTASPRAQIVFTKMATGVHEFVSINGEMHCKKCMVHETWPLAEKRCA